MASLNDLKGMLNKSSLSEIWQNIKNYISSALSSKADKTTVNAHTSDSTIHVTQSDKDKWDSISTDNFATKTELASKSDTSHTHDERYYTESEVDTKLTDYATIAMLNSYVPFAGDKSIWQFRGVFITGDATYKESVLKQTVYDVGGLWRVTFIFISPYSESSGGTSSAYFPKDSIDCQWFYLAIPTTGEVFIRVDTTNPWNVAQPSGLCFQTNTSFGLRQASVGFYQGICISSISKPS